MREVPAWLVRVLAERLERGELLGYVAADDGREQGNSSLSAPPERKSKSLTSCVPSAVG